jgi:hypothetical protein
MPKAAQAAKARKAGKRESGSTQLPPANDAPREDVDHGSGAAGGLRSQSIAGLLGHHQAVAAAIEYPDAEAAERGAQDIGAVARRCHQSLMCDSDRRCQCQVFARSAKPQATAPHPVERVHTLWRDVPARVRAVSEEAFPALDRVCTQQRRL